MNTTPVQKRKCKSCPFRDTPEALTEVRELLIRRAVTEGTPECHSTGQGAKDILGETRDIPARLCRGARDLQLQIFAGIGFIAEATDAAWDAKRKKLGV